MGFMIPNVITAEEDGTTNQKLQKIIIPEILEAGLDTREWSYFTVRAGNLIH